MEVPLDVVMQYFYTAKEQSSLLPLSQRLAWLEARDLEDRSDCVARFRKSSKTLGEVIKETCLARDKRWVPHAVPGVTRTETSKSPQPSPTATQAPSHFLLGKAGEREEGAAFQHGQCKQDHALRASTGAALW